MKRKNLLQRYLYVQMLLLELGALLNGSPEEPLLLEISGNCSLLFNVMEIIPSLGGKHKLFSSW